MYVYNILMEMNYMTNLSLPLRKDREKGFSLRGELDWIVLERNPSSVSSLYIIHFARKSYYTSNKTINTLFNMHTCVYI